MSQTLDVGICDRNDNSRKWEMDPVGLYMPVISIDHHKIHDAVSHEFHADTANVVSAGLNVAFKTKAGTKVAHMLFGLDISDEVKVELIEGATWTQGSGTAIDIEFVNRYVRALSGLLLEDKNQATFTASQQVIQDVTGISGGTVFDRQYTYNAGLGASIVAESRETRHEWPLDVDTTYIMRLTQTNGNCKLTISGHWYEQEHGNG